MKHKHVKAYMECAEAFAKCSPAKRLKVGAVIVKDNRVISCGYNAQPEHINDPCELPDGTTDPRVRHAEKNALMGLVRSNQSAVGADLFCTHSCCVYCAIDIVDAGIKRVYFGKHYRDDSGLEYLKNNGVEVVELKSESEKPSKTTDDSVPSDQMHEWVFISQVYGKSRTYQCVNCKGVQYVKEGQAVNVPIYCKDGLGKIVYDSAHVVD